VSPTAFLSLRLRSDYLPPPIRRRGQRTVAGNLASLPGVCADPNRRGDPWQSLHNIGPGDFQGFGRGLADGPHRPMAVEAL